MDSRRSRFFNDLVAGGISSCVSTFCTHPLDLLQTRLQGSRELMNVRAARSSFVLTRTFHGITSIVKYEGWLGLGRGLLPSVAGIAPGRAIFFGVYEFSRHCLHNRGFQIDSALTCFIASTLGCIANTTILNPLFVLKTRYQLQEDLIHSSSKDRSYGTHYTSYADCAKRMWRHEGWRSFYRGITASWLGISETALYFILYESVKKRLGLTSRLHDGERMFPAHVIIGVSSACKLVASGLTYPHEVVRTRMREAPVGPGREVKYQRLWSSFRTIWLEEGMGGLFGGLSAHLVRVVPNAAILFLSYEFLRHRIFKNMQ